MDWKELLKGQKRQLVNTKTVNVGQEMDLPYAENFEKNFGAGRVLAFLCMISKIAFCIECI